MPTYAETESSLSLAMVEEALKNPTVKAVLTEIATRLQAEVLPLLPLLIEQEGFDKSPALASLAMQHSKGDEFVGALLPGYSADELKKTIEGRELLFSTIAKCLHNANNISTRHDFIALMKTIDGMAFIYDAFETKKENPFHLRCKNYIAPTAEEVAIRARRADDLLATTYGSGTEMGRDLVLQKDTPTGCLSGKARFFILPVEHRAKIWFEKLADQRSMNKPALPLIASSSNAAAKSLMMVQGMNLFLMKDTGLFNFDKAQIFSNCLMAYLVYCGHHSFLEVAEIWNRQLDFVVIERPEQLPIGLIPVEPTVLPYIEEPRAVERQLPYAHVGNYADAVIARTQSQLTEGLNLVFSDSSSGCLVKS